MRSQELYVKKCLENRIKNMIRVDSVTKRHIGILAFIVNPGYTKDDEKESKKHKVVKLNLVQ